MHIFFNFYTFVGIGYRPFLDEVIVLMKSNRIILMNKFGQVKTFQMQALFSRECEDEINYTFILMNKERYQSERSDPELS